MRIKRFLLGLIIVSVVWVLFPIFLVFLNNSFNLPVYNYLLFKIIGFPLLVIGFLIVLYFTKLHLETRRTTPLPVIEPPKRLISKELYKYSRNPMYLAIMTTFLGAFFFFGHLLLFVYFLISIPVLHLFVIYVEEPELKRKFGKQYIEYMKKTPRWI